MRPESEQELAEIIRMAAEPLCIRGGGTRGCSVPGKMLDTGALRGIRLYEPGALTMVAGAGTPLAEIEATLADEGQMLAFEPMALFGAGAGSTIGGVFATNASGPRRVQAGAARDFLLGVRFVDGAGTIIANGGRVMKNVTGYDLVKLQAGAHGTLGVLTEVAFKLLPRPDVVRSLVVHGLDLRAGGAILRRALAAPYDVTGAALVPEGGGRFAAYLRLEGFEESVAYRAGALADRLGGGDVLAGVDWAAIGAAQCLAGEGDIWRISTPPADGPVVAEAMGAEACLLDWGGGLIWARVAPGSDLRLRLAGLRGHARLMRGEGPMRFQPEADPIARISAALRAQFDPRGILNSGLMA